MSSPIPIASAFEPFETPANNTVKGCKWSPDGLCLLTASEEDRQLRLFELPAHLMAAAAADGVSTGGKMDTMAAAAAAGAGPSGSELQPALAVREGESIYDYAWFPGMDSSNPVTCVFASTSREQPLHLWDAYSGQCRASYVSYNHLDEVTAPHSLAFNPSGARLYCGFDRCVRVFDVSRPGRQCDVRPTCKTKRSRDGLRGLLSCFAFAPDYPDLYACGSFSGTTGLYDERDPSHLIVELEAHGGGVTQLSFSHDGTMLYSAARRDDQIRCWDIRSTCRVLATFRRAAPTNQKIGFELIDSASSALLTASQDGSVLLYDTTNPQAEPATLLTFGDATNAATRHPSLPLLAVASGERRFDLSRDHDLPRGKKRQQAESGGYGGQSEQGEEASESDDGETNGGPRKANGLSIWMMPQHHAAVGSAGGEARDVGQ